MGSSKRAQVVILAEAQREYEDIVSYLAVTAQSPSAARSFMGEFDRQVELIADYPEIHPLSHLRELAAKGYRAFAVGKYLALYKIDDTSVVISHIFHRSRDYARLV